MPWSSGGGNQGPWGGPPRGPRPPNLEDLLKGGQDRFRQIFPGGFWATSGIVFVAAAILAIWLLFGFYRVLPDEQGVVLRFGAYDRTTAPGLHYHLPPPIETVYTPKVTVVNQIDIGFRRTGFRGEKVDQVPEESLMLTGDENIVDVSFTVQWLINNARDYLFNIRAPEATVKAAAESAMREIVGQTPIASTPVTVDTESAEPGAAPPQQLNPLAKERGSIEQETKELLQRILDSYGAGIKIVNVQLQKVYPPPAVVDAFLDVQRAVTDKERLVNEAQAYRNDIIPRARGEAAQIIQQAEGYKQEIVARAEGDAKRFLSVYESYLLDKNVTAQRLYLETMESVLRNIKKIIIDKSASGSGVVPYLPLPELKARSQGQGGDSVGSEDSTPSVPTMTLPPANAPSNSRSGGQ